MAEFKYVGINSLKEGNVIDIEGYACKIVSIEKSKPGKHGAAKARIVGIDIFSDKKCTLLASSGDEAQAPVVQRSNAQVVADLGDNIQIMDMSSYETIEVKKPAEKDIFEKLTNGCEVEYLRLDDKIRIVRVK